MTDWRETPRAALRGQTIDFDAYNPIHTGYEDVYTRGAVDLALAAAVSRHVREATGQVIPYGAMENLANHINAWLRNIALGAEVEPEYDALMQALRRTLPDPRDIEAAIAAQAGCTDETPCPICYRTQHCDERCDDVDREMARLFR